MSYRIALPAFHGPMDLLLHLVKKHEVDILDIPISQVTEQFLEALSVMQLLDVELAGEFIVTAATLMEIKSQMLLPESQSTETAETVDPRRELVRQLLEYRKYRDAAARLEGLSQTQLRRLGRSVPPEPSRADEPPAVRVVELWDLVSAFSRLMRETMALQPRQIIVDDTPQHVYESQVRDRVAAEGRVAFRDLFVGVFHKIKLIGLFLAVLELIKQRFIQLEQSERFGEIWLSIRQDPERN
ncbi:segregation and condensation protein A [Tuwongella immobilis]|nr:segregation/condensation protein A [Tuwongella immobilis]